MAALFKMSYSFLVFISICIPILYISNSINVLGGDKLIIDGTLVHDPSFIPGTPYYVLTQNSTIVIPSQSKVCPSTDCRVVIDPSYPISFELQKLDSMKLGGTFRLLDNLSNSKFTPMKKALVEKMQISFSCNMKDIIEDQRANTTEYICGKDRDTLDITRYFNDTYYTYHNVSMSLKVPTFHLTLKAIEE